MRKGSTSVEEVLRRIYAKVRQCPDTGCFLWEGGLRRGYGRIRVAGVDDSVHRILYSLFKGGIPKSLLLCHTCDTRNCVNIEHLFVGTHQDNMRDMMAKGRHHRPRGVLNPRAKLSDQVILDIRELSSFGWGNQKISRLFGISASHYRKIIAGAIWSHVTEKEVSNPTKKVARRTPETSRARKSTPRKAATYCTA